MSEYILEMKNITKEFSGVKALENVNLKVKEGEIHAIMGENGAGKSTLMNVLSGVYPFGEYTGDIVYQGEVSKFNHLKDSEEKGIVIIHQELALIQFLSVMENIFLGNEQANNGVIDWNLSRIKAKELLEKVGSNIDSDTQLSQISVAQQQLVEIAKAFSKDVKLLILDEPTAALNDIDSENLLELLKEFKKEGITSIIISHKLNEIMYVSDRVTILRDGKTIETLDNDENLTEDNIIKGMVGRELTNRYPIREPKIGEVTLEVKNWSVNHPVYQDNLVLDDINIHLRKGEIVGIAGLMGAGRTELAKSIFGKAYGHNIQGQLTKDGKEITLNSIPEAINHGLAYLTEDRKGNGLNLIQTIKENITIASLDKVSNNGVIDADKERATVNEYKKSLNIKSTSIDQRVGALSGGNQQKVSFGKWILSNPEILFLDEPTRGVDVGAKYEIYNVINNIASEGNAVCVISSELPELLGICDRIYVLSEGKLTGEVMREDATQELLMELMTLNIKEGVS